MKCTEAGKKKDRQTDGEESEARRVEQRAQIGREAKQARQSKEKKEKCKGREGGWGENDNGSMKEYQKMDGRIDRDTEERERYRGESLPAVGRSGLSIIIKITDSI